MNATFKSCENISTGYHCKTYDEYQSAGRKNGHHGFKSWASQNTLTSKPRKAKIFNKLFPKRFSQTVGIRDKGEHIDDSVTSGGNEIERSVVFNSSKDLTFEYDCNRKYENSNGENKKGSGSKLPHYENAESTFQLQDYIPKECEAKDFYTKLLELLKQRDSYIENLKIMINERDKIQDVSVPRFELSSNNTSRSLTGLNKICMEDNNSSFGKSNAKIEKFSSATNLDKICNTPYNTSDTSMYYNCDIGQLCESLYDFWLPKSIEIMGDISKTHGIANDAISIDHTMRKNLNKIVQFIESITIKHISPIKASKSKSSSSASMLDFKIFKECLNQVALIFEIQIYMYIVDEIMNLKIGCRYAIDIDLAKKIDIIVYALDPMNHSFKNWQEDILNDKKSITV